MQRNRPVDHRGPDAVLVHVLETEPRVRTSVPRVVISWWQREADHLLFADPPRDAIDRLDVGTAFRKGMGEPRSPEVRLQMVQVDVVVARVGTGSSIDLPSPLLVSTRWNNRVTISDASTGPGRLGPIVLPRRGRTFESSHPLSRMPRSWPISGSSGASKPSPRVGGSVVAGDCANPEATRTVSATDHNLESDVGTFMSISFVRLGAVAEIDRDDRLGVRRSTDPSGARQKLTS